MQKRVAILGSTGSIGTQALEVIDAHPDLFSVEVLTANNNVQLLVSQAKRYSPNVVVIANKEKYNEVKDKLADEPVKVYSGGEAVAQTASMSTVDIVLSALVGFSGLKPTIEAINAGIAVALANKETLVIAGEYVMELAAKKHVPIIPVDSEHSAIFQCLQGEYNNPVEKITLTASGGPFRGKSTDFLKTVTCCEALKHPNWDMGAKITIDSASMMNKGLEAIEARWLFNLKPEQIEVVVHPQSIVHSMVQFYDGSIKAQLGLPDMKLPIQYALGYPNRISNKFKRFDFVDYPSLTFERADYDSFKNLKIAFDVMNMGGNMPCVLNAANEVAVEAFLNSRLGFVEMSYLIMETIEKSSFISNPSYDDYLTTDTVTRSLATEFLNDRKKIV
ncbi:1-deoxy-D-xylulose-5-phosphate reductoisomerase [Marinilabiliaceae bacterium ANBcel2]|nr:1-deoxy-D-xylulose-5-phosphate reductoisomerase [Marinilabiliaceae bacterium ANBcel2]